MKPLILLLATSSLLAGCAAFPQDPDQIVNISTSPNVSARCFVQNARGAWSTPTTPADISILRSPSPLSIDCTDNVSNGTGHVDVAATSGMTAATGENPGGTVVGSNTAPSDAPMNGGTIAQMRGSFSQYPSTIVVPITIPNQIPPAIVAPMPTPTPTTTKKSQHHSKPHQTYVPGKAS